MTVTIDNAGVEILLSLLMEDSLLRGYAARFPEANNLYREAKMRVSIKTVESPKKQRHAKNEMKHNVS
jgi:hypothetical protein